MHIIFTKEELIDDGEMIIIVWKYCMEMMIIYWISMERMENKG
jgi:hypothetical protein